MKKCILIIFILVSPLKLFSAIMFSPELEWKSIKTNHFWIHYHQGLETEAKKLAQIAEKVHLLLSPKIKWQPALRTDVILVDNLYTANGFATPFPYNRIQIYMTRPEPDSSISNFDNWLEMVFTHEYVHILNHDMIHGLPSISRYTLGRCCFPNVFLPYWMAEGNAVYYESYSSKFGRNNSSYTDMVMRTEIANNSFKTISEASNFPRAWPVGYVPYLYGGLFVEFLETKYGTGSFADIYIDNSYNLIPYSDHIIPYILPFIDSEAEKIYGEKFTTLWDEWEAFLKIKYDKQIKNIKEKEITDYKQITKSGYFTSLPRFSRNNKEIFYIRKTNYNSTALVSYSITTGKQKVLCPVNDPNSISITGNDRIFLSDAEYYKSFSIYNEAFVYDKTYKQITSRLRGSYIDIDPKENRAVFVKEENNKFSLILSDLSFSAFNILIDKTDLQIAYTKFSPDGENIVFTLKDETGDADIAILTIATGNILRISRDKYNDIQPSWHPDGNRIIFSSDRDGVYNLYEFNINKKTLSKLTNFIGGGFSPDISPDGKSLTFAYYGKNGFNIALMHYPEKALSITNINPQDIPVQIFDHLPNEQDDNTITISNFTVLNSIFPPFWLPLIANSEVYNNKSQLIAGFFTLGYDTLYKNMYIINAYTYTYEKRASVNLSYNFSYLYPEIIMQYYNDALFYGEDKFPWEEKNTNPLKREMEKSGTIGLAFPFIYYQTSHVLSFSYKYSKSYTDIFEPGTNENYKDIIAKVRLKYSFIDSKEYSYSVSRENGRDIYIISDLYRKELGSDISYSKTMGEYSEYLPGLCRNNVLLLNIRGGASFNNPDYKSPYNLGKFEKGEIGLPETEEDELGLRGYPSGIIYGNRIAAGTIEYRFPVIQTDFGLATFPVLFRDLWLTPFFDYGNVWNGNTKINEFKSSTGIELHMRITAGYMLNLEGYIGFAKGLNQYGEDQIYFAVSTLFEGALKNNYKWLNYL